MPGLDVRRLVMVLVLVGTLAGLPGVAVADTVLFDEDFRGTTLATPFTLRGTFTPCLTASASTSSATSPTTARPAATAARGAPTSICTPSRLR
jgi:hypothetical protein